MAKFYKFFKDLFSKRQEQTAEQKIIAFRNNTARLQEESSGNDLEDELQDLLNRSGAGQSSRPPTVTFEHTNLREEVRIMVALASAAIRRGTNVDSRHRYLSNQEDSRLVQIHMRHFTLLQ